MERKRTPVYGIKGKLVSACCMLLVAVIMVVSSTYAWFTLSTAPEVKGISTAIGANGALEIRLNGPLTDTNSEFGNLVDLGDERYGLNTFVLRPSKLVLDADGKVNNRYLVIPQYNEYGKVTGTSGERTEAGIFKDGKFVAGEGTGVRAVGVASGLTDRQLAYRNAKYAASTNSSLATNSAASSLNTNGSVLGNIVIKKATVEGATYTAAEIASLQAIVNDLSGTENTTGVLEYIENAYEQMLVAFAASAKLDAIAGSDNVALADAIYSTVKANIADGTLTLADIADEDAIVVTVSEGSYEFDLTGTPILTGIEALITTQANVAAAQDALDALDESKTEYTWAEVSGILQYLIETDSVTVNGKTATEIKADMSGFASSVMSNGINIELNTGAGVYVEIADHCGNYSASVTMTNVEVQGVTFDSLTANMATKSVVSPSHLALSQTAVVAAGEPSGATTDAQPMTEFYGYIIDLIFRTNAANSSLLLQTEATDRIYAGNNNELTQGSGSTMTYASADKDFTTDQVKGLMECIRIVFFDTDSREVLGYAMLDVANATVGADGVTAKIYMYETVDTYTHTYLPDGKTDEADKVIEKYYIEATTSGETTTYKYFDFETAADVTSNVVAKFENAETAIPEAFVKGETVNRAITGAKDSDDAPIITALAQNQEVKVSTLVYLDGEKLENKDVSATQQASVVGKMNLQFSSSADLTPMEYGDLHITGNESETTETN